MSLASPEPVRAAADLRHDEALRARVRELAGPGAGQSLLFLALADLAAALRRWPLWVTLGWHDILARYRRTTLGPFWNTLSTAVSIGGLALVYGTIFNVELREFIPYLAGGIIAWTFISTLVIDGSQTFECPTNANIIKNVPVPLGIHVFRMIFKNLLLFAHNLPVYAVLALIVGLPATASMLLILPGLLFVMMSACWVALLFGTLGARFRDLSPIVAALTNVAFFITPVIWDRQMLGEHQFIAYLNPFTHFVSVVRDPMIGKAPTAETWIFVAAITAVGWCAALWVFSRYRARIVLWL